MACGYLQRCTATEGIAWDSVISEGIQAKANDVAERLRDQGDPLFGSWPVDLTQEVVLWTDASSVAIGVALEVGGEVVEDAAWLRRAGDARHINMSKLEAAIREINMCLRWKIWQLTLRTDSATVCGWLKAIFQRTQPVGSNRCSAAEDNPFTMGDAVFLQRGPACDQPWTGPHRVTAIPSAVSVTLDGGDVPRHVFHIQ